MNELYSSVMLFKGSRSEKLSVPMRNISLKEFLTDDSTGESQDRRTLSMLISPEILIHQESEGPAS